MKCGNLVADTWYVQHNFRIILELLLHISRSKISTLCAAELEHSLVAISSCSMSCCKDIGCACVSKVFDTSHVHTHPV